MNCELNIEFTTLTLAADEEMLTESGIRDNDWWAEDKIVVPTHIGVVGSAVIDDMEAVELFYGSTFIGNFEATTIGVVMPLEARDMKVISPQRSVKLKDLKLYCREAPTTNQLSVRIVTR